MLLDVLPVLSCVILDLYVLLVAPFNGGVKNKRCAEKPPPVKGKGGIGRGSVEFTGFLYPAAQPIMACIQAVRAKIVTKASHFSRVFSGKVGSNMGTRVTKNEGWSE